MILSWQNKSCQNLISYIYFIKKAGGLRVAFPEGIRKRILRNGTTWQDVCAVREDKTRSGKTKRMLASSMAKRTFTVKMRFTYDEYLIFENWYNNVCLKGLNSFAFPQIDLIDGSEKEYRFTSTSAPQFSNPSGQLYECSMQWEEV